MTTDRIEKQIVLNAPLARVWRAISDSQEFGAWFGVRIDGPFVPGQRITGRITTPGYEHLSMELFVEEISPERLLSYRWHPYAIDPNVDYSSEPTTLVEFLLAEVDGGTRLTVVESGFDQIPAERRDEAFRMNEGGWAAQVENIARYVSG
jgi:uncharacterized protein YndB with AHSA1/START domain